MKCPCCKGSGGEVEAVLDYGQGQYYPCGFCNDRTKVNIFKWLQWKVWEHEDRAYNKRIEHPTNKEE